MLAAVRHELPGIDSLDASLLTTRSGVLQKLARMIDRTANDEPRCLGRAGIRNAPSPIAGRGRQCARRPRERKACAFQFADATEGVKPMKVRPAANRHSGGRRQEFTWTRG